MIRSEREARVATLAARIETLKQEREARLQDFDCRLEDNEAIIAELEPKSGTPQSSEAEPSQDMPPQVGASEEEDPPG